MNNALRKKKPTHLTCVKWVGSHSPPTGEFLFDQSDYGFGVDPGLTGITGLVGTTGAVGFAGNVGNAIIAAARILVAAATAATRALRATWRAAAVVVPAVAAA